MFLFERALAVAKRVDSHPTSGALPAHVEHLEQPAAKQSAQDGVHKASMASGSAVASAGSAAAAASASSAAAPMNLCAPSAFQVKHVILCNNLMLVECIECDPLAFHVVPFDSPKLQLTLQVTHISTSCLFIFICVFAFTSSSLLRH